MAGAFFMDHVLAHGLDVGHIGQIAGQATAGNDAAFVVGKVATAQAHVTTREDLARR